MVRTLLLATALILAAGPLALAQERELPPHDAPAGNAPTSGAGVRSGNITSTGATVPNPGASQGAGTTSLDRGIQAEDNKITGTICKGC